MIISVFNQKGGCGKSTTCCNLGAYLSRHGRKVLLVDIDPQANLTVSVGIDDETLNKTIYDLLRSSESKKERILEVIQETSYERLSIIPSDITLSDAEITLSSLMKREEILKRILNQIKDRYDYILIDCPPKFRITFN
ncbi:AAA family ATPase [Clostridium sp.]|uniref:ParA family protein n=1 Tax=Clostridium sp. TaxID=1506 RepID=UPI001A5564D5|nr:AAA family ATPase [Clostridium sp.]MBK5236015.1 AAA family ATPase [Clostridium sp.]